MDVVRIKSLLFFEKMGRGTVILLAGIVLCFLTVTGFAEWAYLGQGAEEQHVFLKHGIPFNALMLLSLFLIFLVRNDVARIRSKKLFFALSCFYLVAGMYLVFNASPELRSDAVIVFQKAEQMNQGDFSTLGKGGYLFSYPHQLGLVTYERILMKFSPNVKFFFTLNLLMVLVINYMQWKISEIFSDNDAQVVNYTILFSFGFMSQLFFILFLYNLIPGFCCTIAAVYFMMRYFRERNLKDCILSVVLIAAASTLRNNFMIAAIAMFFLYLLDYFHSGRKRCVLIALAAIVCAVMLPKGVNAWYRHESGIDFERGIPKILWVAMGLQDAPIGSEGKWDGYVMTVPWEYDFDYELLRERGLTDLQGRLDYFKENPDEALRFFKNKAVSTWLDPLFQSMWTGPKEVCDQHMRIQPLSDFYAGKGPYWFITRILNVLLVVIYLMSLLYMVFALAIKKASLTNEKLFPYIFFLGGVFFHLIWETKSQYVHPYVFMLIPLAALGIKLVGDWLSRYLKGRTFQEKRGEETHETI